MIMINGQWESVENLDDVIHICRENIGNEFADRAEEIIEDEMDMQKF